MQEGQGEAPSSFLLICIYSVDANVLKADGDNNTIHVQEEFPAWERSYAANLLAPGISFSSVFWNFLQVLLEIL